MLNRLKTLSKDYLISLRVNIIPELIVLIFFVIGWDFLERLFKIHWSLEVIVGISALLMLHPSAVKWIKGTKPRKRRTPKEEIKEQQTTEEVKVI